ncbi:hypothetical protein SAMN05421548_107113 [Paraburkholderia lycopersici]|uniref:Uncharacterized protein n=1 Tax=Paraburkholderia lycopersici TaxID=416944 RepID=A0A1G6M2R0_9BURK|nr:hypothetical protein SAMN05421548_107113 [Paraburkholderia lycopersici]
MRKRILAFCVPTLFLTNLPAIVITSECPNEVTQVGVRYVTISKFSEEPGFSEHAISTEISRGAWAEGEV